MSINTIKMKNSLKSKISNKKTNNPININSNPTPGKFIFKNDVNKLASSYMNMSQKIQTNRNFLKTCSNLNKRSSDFSLNNSCAKCKDLKQSLISNTNLSFNINNNSCNHLEKQTFSKDNYVIHVNKSKRHLPLLSFASVNTNRVPSYNKGSSREKNNKKKVMNYSILNDTNIDIRECYKYKDNKKLFNKSKSKPKKFKKHFKSINTNRQRFSVSFNKNLHNKTNSNALQNKNTEKHNNNSKINRIESCKRNKNPHLRCNTVIMEEKEIKNILEKRDKNEKKAKNNVAKNNNKYIKINIEKSNINSAENNLLNNERISSQNNERNNQLTKKEIFDKEFNLSKKNQSNRTFINKKEDNKGVYMNELNKKKIKINLNKLIEEIKNTKIKIDYKRTINKKTNKIIVKENKKYETRSNFYKKIPKLLSKTKKSETSKQFYINKNKYTLNDYTNNNKENCENDSNLPLKKTIGKNINIHNSFIQNENSLYSFTNRNDELNSQLSLKIKTNKTENYNKILTTNDSIGKQKNNSTIIQREPFTKKIVSYSSRTNFFNNRKLNQIINNELFDEINLEDSPNNINLEQDKMNDLYSVVKAINFGTVLIGVESIFSNNSKLYDEYKNNFDYIYNINYGKQKMMMTNKINKERKIIRTSSDKTCFTSSQKTFSNNKNDNPKKTQRFIIND